MTIGRTAARSRQTLASRYLGARAIYVLYEGTFGMCDFLERALQELARESFGRRVWNRRLGGGKHVPRAAQIVYVVVWLANEPEVVVTRAYDRRVARCAT